MKFILPRDRSATSPFNHTHATTVRRRASPCSSITPFAPAPRLDRGRSRRGLDYLLRVLRTCWFRGKTGWLAPGRCPQIQPAPPRGPAPPPHRPNPSLMHPSGPVASHSPPWERPGTAFQRPIPNRMPPPPNVLFEYRKRAGFEDGLPRDLRQQEATWRHDETVSVHGCHRGAHSSRAGLHHASLPK